ncbi:hypothetical protein [Spongiactinospora sp. 9N601]|uniref:hypothetical protein n=1 Tax=Spongiactinospora sp. 9N601 TaxID=3375149 RepID=UPI0037BCBD5D
MRRTTLLPYVYDWADPLLLVTLIADAPATGATAKAASTAPARMASGLTGRLNLLNTGILLLASLDALWAGPPKAFRPQPDSSPLIFTLPGPLDQVQREVEQHTYKFEPFKVIVDHAG